MCTDLCPELQEEEHARILPALLAVMDDFENPRVQAHSAAAVVNFTEGGSQVWGNFILLAWVTCLLQLVSFEILLFFHSVMYPSW